MRFKKLIIHLSLVLSLLSLATPTLAEKKHKKVKSAPPADVLVQPELPNDNIGGKHSGYFNLKKSSKKRIIEVKVFNTTNYPLNVQTKLYNTSTLDNGVVDYTGRKKNDKKLLKNPATNYLKSGRTLKIPARQTGIAKIKVSPTGFTGTKSAAINIISKPDHQNGVIKNKYAYAIGIILNGDKLKIRNLKKTDVVNVSLNNSKSKIQTKIDNRDAVFLLNGKIDLSLQSAKWFLFRYEKVRDSVNVAPNTSFNYDISLKGMRLVPGAYKLILKNKNDLYKQVQYKYLVISKNGDIRLVNKHVYDLVRMKSIIVMALIAILIIGTSVVIWRKKRK